MKNKAKYNKELIVSSTTDNLAMIRHFINETANDIGLTEELKGKIMLSVDEACTNIIKHAYKYSSTGNINITVSVNKSQYKVTITDDGTHFHPEKIPDPDLVKYHQQKKVGGLGMFLMKKLMDEVVYKTLKNDRNQVVLVKYLS